MSRWIDVDRLTRKLIGAIWLGEKVDMPTGELEAVLNDVLSAPSIDIVRCKDCENWDGEEHWCNIRDSYGWDYKPDDFCSYGERRER